MAGALSGGRVVVTATGTVKIQGVKKAIKLTSRTATIAAGRSATPQKPLVAIGRG